MTVLIRSLTLLILPAFILTGCHKDEGKFTPIPEPLVKPVISFTFTGANAWAPAAVSFSNTTTHAAAYKWNFGDNHTSTEGNPVHIYAEGGTYIVKLVAAGSGGTDSSTQVLTILDAPTTLKIKSVVLTGCSFTNSWGNYWDPTSGPDIFFKITDSDTTVLYDGFALIDSNSAPAHLPLVWSLPTAYTIHDFSEYKSFKIYDYDFPDPDESMGQAGLTPETYTTAQSHYPDSIKINTADVFITLVVKWQ